MGKGDKRRPKFISDEQYAKNFERTFGKDKRKKKKCHIEN